MAETSRDDPLIPKHTRSALHALGLLFIYSIAMFTLPFAAFFGVRHFLTESYPVEVFTRNVYSVISAVLVMYLIIFSYAYKAYHEKEYDDDGNEINPFTYQSNSTDTDKSSLNLKED